ncbi:helix-turn-helix domain-containing protein [Sinomonas sp. P47F7]|uniref:helix-turn-helix domain-containing protein n=1 Tax=Sinomonas sp. P47F7 TaxID=3410987 RepID=UPI003BF548A1
MSRREIDYTWRVREIMARRGVHTAKDLAELLHERGITLTANAVWRIVTQEPERISFKVLVALCDALDVTPNDLITYTATDAKTVRQPRKAAGDEIPDLRQYRPVRARIVEDDE